MTQTIQAQIDPREIRVFGYGNCDELYIAVPITLDAACTNMRSGTVLGRVAATGKFKPYNALASDGTQYPVGLLMQDNIDPAAGGVDVFGTVSMYLTGWFKKSLLVGLDANAAAVLGRSFNWGGSNDWFQLGSVMGGAGSQAVYRTWAGANVPAASNTAYKGSANVVALGQTISSGFTQPAVPRVPKLVLGGTTGDIKAGTWTLTGKDEDGNTITDTAVSQDDSATLVSNFTKAFASITSLVQPAQDGTGATFSLGSTDKLGLGVKLPVNTVKATYLGGSLEGTPATVAVSTSSLASNTVDPNSALNGTDVMVFFDIPVAFDVRPLPS